MKRPHVRSGLCLFLPVLAWVACSGCVAASYVIQLADGQFAVNGNVEPIDSVLASGQLSEQDAAKLRLIVLARDYAANTIGLNAGDAYTTFYDTQGDPLAWNLSAARRDALVPKTWRVPIAGEFPYLTFFDEPFLRQTEQDLLNAGYDTFSYELDAYSTLGVFADPVRSPMLQRDPLSLVETIIHELLHNTVWRASQTTFNESLATFVGRQGAVDFLQVTFGDASGWPEFATKFYADNDAVNAFLMQLYADLDAYFAQPLTSDEKVAGRDAVYQAARDRFSAQVQPTLNYPDVFGGYAGLPTNNAWVLGNHRYNLDLGVFAAVYTANASNWPATLDVFRAAVAAPDDPVAYLRDWVAAHSAP